VVPAWGRNAEPVSVTIEGENFLALATQHIGGREPISVDARFEAFLGEVALEDVTLEDARTLRARVPAGLGPGWHTLSLVGPLGQRAELPRAYFSSDQPLAMLQARAALEREQVLMGERTRLVLTVENVGGTNALGVTPVLSQVGEGRVEIVSAPEAVDVLAGGSTYLTWELGAAAPGDVRFSMEASGHESEFGAELRVSGVEVGPLRIRPSPGLLTARFLPLPERINLGQPFDIELEVTNTGGSTVLGVKPVASTSANTGQVTLVSGPEPASADIAPGGLVVFRARVIGTGEGPFSASTEAGGVEQTSGAPVMAPRVASSTVLLLRPVSFAVELMRTDPFKDGSAFAQVFSYGGRLVLGPNRSGTKAVRVDPMGAADSDFSFSFPKDTSGNSSQNNSPPRYSSIGATGCTPNTASCGPDNEDGRGFFFAGRVGTQEWLGIGGARSNGDLDYLYFAQNTDSVLDMRFVDLTSLLGGQTRGFSSALFFRDRLYVGFSDTGGNRPYLLVIKRLPTLAPGYEASQGLDAEDLKAENMPGIGQGGTPPNNASLVMIDTLTAFNDRLYLANNGGCVRSTTATPRSYGSAPGDWASCTPQGAAWSTRSSRTTSKTADLEPADRTVPRMAVFNGRLYLARNTWGGPQLFACDPARGGSPTDCDPGDWSLVAPNIVGDTLLTQFNNTGNTAVSLLVATASSLYVGFDNPTQGTVLLRASGPTPSTQADFVGSAGCSAAQHPATCAGLGGNGLGVGATRFFDGVASSLGGTDDLYFTAGNGTSAVRLFRVKD
jgi:hypothetical protein